MRRPRTAMATWLGVMAVLAGTSCGGGGACGSTEAPSTPLAALVAKDARPATLGSIDLLFEGGPIPGRLVGRGAACEWREGFYLDRNDILGRDVGADWQFRLDPLDDDPTRAELVFVDRGRPAPGDPDDPNEVPSVTYRRELPWSSLQVEKRAGKGHRFTLDHTLVSTDSAVLRVKGTVTCPETGDLGDHGPALLDRLARLSARPPRTDCGVDFGRERIPGCVSVLIPDDEEADRVVAQLRKDLGPGWVVYIGTTNFLGEERNEGLVELVIAPGRDLWDILVTARTNAINFGLDTPGLILALQPLHAEVGFEILGAETDSLHVAMSRLPSDPEAFAKKFHDVCPDIVDQGVGSIDALVREFMKSRQLYFWWD